MSKLRTVSRLVTAHRQREGGGFIVRRPYPTAGLDLVDPFLLLDEMGPVDYRPGEAVGAPDHPHRGFETVTYLLEGESRARGFRRAHRDAAPGRRPVDDCRLGGGALGASLERIREQGGRVHGFQVWVNLPRRDKLMKPRYQEVPAASIPVGRSADGLAEVRVVAGEALGARAVIETRTPIFFQDWTLRAGAQVTLPLPAEHQASAYVFGGEALVAGTPVPDGQLALLGPGDAVELGVAQTATAPARLLLLSGVPLREPVARYGPFVMNTPEEIHQAIVDFQAGRMGEIHRSP